MASFNLTWTPAGGANSKEQEIHYKKVVSPHWIKVATVGISKSFYTIKNLEENEPYDFVVVNIGPRGEIRPSNRVMAIAHLKTTSNE